MERIQFKKLIIAQVATKSCFLLTSIKVTLCFSLFTLRPLSRLGLCIAGYLRHRFGPLYCLLVANIPPPSSSRNV
jgi:hypothetical protein